MTPANTAPPMASAGVSAWPLSVRSVDNSP